MTSLLNGVFVNLTDVKTSKSVTPERAVRYYLKTSNSHFLVTSLSVALSQLFFEVPNMVNYIQTIRLIHWIERGWETRKLSINCNQSIHASQETWPPPPSYFKTCSLLTYKHTDIQPTYNWHTAYCYKWLHTFRIYKCMKQNDILLLRKRNAETN